MKNFTKIFFSILTFYFLTYCSKGNNVDKYKELKKIIQSDIIEKNHKDSYFNDSRNKNIFIYVDSTDTKYLVNLDKNELVYSKNTLSNSEKLKKLKDLIKIKENLEFLKIKSIFPGNKYFTVYTKIKSDSTYQEIINSDSIFQDIDYDINKGDYYFALINFKDSKLDSTLIKKFKLEHGLRPFYKNWFYYRFQN